MPVSLDPTTGGCHDIIYQTSTHAPSLSWTNPWGYARTSNPTRSALEDCIAALEKGQYGTVFSSGVSAIDAVIRLLSPRDLVVCGDDIYGGGTHRLFTKEWTRYGIEFVFVDTSDPNLTIPEQAKMVWVETPTNPLLKVTDIRTIVEEMSRTDSSCCRQYLCNTCFSTTTDGGSRHRGTFDDQVPEWSFGCDCRCGCGE